MLHQNDLRIHEHRFERYDNTQDNTCLKTLIGRYLLSKTSYVAVQLKEIRFFYNYKLLCNTRPSLQGNSAIMYCYCFCVPKIALEMIISGRFLLFEQVYILAKEKLLISILLL